MQAVQCVRHIRGADHRIWQNPVAGGPTFGQAMNAKRVHSTQHDMHVLLNVDPHYWWKILALSIPSLISSSIARSRWRG
eukprot:5565054-Karenia_brevis.AAC.1